MSQFSEQFLGMNLISMHSTNPEPFTKKELELTIGKSFSEILENVSLGFAADEGSVALRQTLTNYHYKSIKPDNIVVHAGAQEALFCAFNALLKNDDRVLVVTPVFEPLISISQNIGCNVRTVQLQSKNNWKLDLQQVEDEFKKGCRLFVSNYPHNPTGTSLSLEEWGQLVELCRRYNVWWLSDEVFRGLEHDKKTRLPAVADVYEKGISIGVISKAFAIPGIRIGWLACQNIKVLQTVVDIKGYLSVCNSQIDDALAAEFLKYSEKLLQRNLKIILGNKKLLKSEDIFFGDQIRMIIPDDGCSLFAELETINADVFVKKTADKSGFLLYPSSLFNTKTNGFRLGFGSHRFVEFINIARGNSNE